MPDVPQRHCADQSFFLPNWQFTLDDKELRNEVVIEAKYVAVSCLRAVNALSQNFWVVCGKYTWRRRPGTGSLLTLDSSLLLGLTQETRATSPYKRTSGHSRMPSAS